MTKQINNMIICKILIIVPRVCSLSMFRVSWRIFCSIPILFDYMRMRLPFFRWSNAGVPSSQALPGYLITAPPSVCVPGVIGALSVWIPNQENVYIYFPQLNFIVGTGFLRESQGKKFFPISGNWLENECGSSLHTTCDRSWRNWWASCVAA